MKLLNYSKKKHKHSVLSVLAIIILLTGIIITLIIRENRQSDMLSPYNILITGELSAKENDPYFAGVSVSYNAILDIGNDIYSLDISVTYRGANAISCKIYKKSDTIMLKIPSLSSYVYSIRQTDILCALMQKNVISKIKCFAVIINTLEGSFDISHTQHTISPPRGTIKPLSYEDWRKLNKKLNIFKVSQVN